MEAKTDLRAGTWFCGYLALGIAHHRLVDFYRVSRPTISWESVPETTAMGEDPEEKVISEETMALVRKVLETLSQQEQELLALRFAARLSSAEIAAIVGKSEAATKKQLTRLLRRLQEQYRRQELETPIPDLLEPALPAFIAVLRQTYAVPVSGVHLDKENCLWCHVALNTNRSQKKKPICS